MVDVDRPEMDISERLVSAQSVPKQNLHQRQLLHLFVKTGYLLMITFTTECNLANNRLLRILMIADAEMKTQEILII